MAWTYLKNVQIYSQLKCCKPKPKAIFFTTMNSMHQKAN